MSIKAPFQIGYLSKKVQLTFTSSISGWNFIDAGSIPIITMSLLDPSGVSSGWTLSMPTPGGGIGVEGSYGSGSTDLDFPQPPLTNEWYSNSPLAFTISGLNSSKSYLVKLAVANDSDTTGIITIGNITKTSNFVFGTPLAKTLFFPVKSDGSGNLACLVSGVTSSDYWVFNAIIIEEIN